MEGTVKIDITGLEEIIARILREKIEEIVKNRRLQSEVMTTKQLAEYWQVSTKSILNWTRGHENPLPVHYVGGNPRFHLSEVNQWSKDAAVLKLASQQ